VRRELHSFASVWMRVKQSGLSPTERELLRTKAVARAAEIKKYWKGKGNIRAVFNSEFKKLLAKKMTG